MRAILSWLALMALAGCPDRPPGALNEREDERPSLSFTQWSERTELFAELRAPVRGQDSPIAAHVTLLQGFAPLREGTVTAVLRDGAAEERFLADKYDVPGIFRPILRPKTAGKRRLIVEIRAAGLSEDHDLGELTVFASNGDAKRANLEQQEPPGRITFLKEQQWPIEFATEVVQERALRALVRAFGTLRPRAEGEVLITAPSAGRVLTSGRPFPQLGQRVEVDDLLGLIAPRLEAADLASLELAVTSAELERGYAQRERARLEGLRKEGAVPERRVQEAVLATERSEAALATAQRRLSQFQRVQHTAGSGRGTLELHAPLTGTITEVQIAPGAFVEAGAPLFRISDTARLWLEARVAEADVLKLETIRGGSFQVEGAEEPLELTPEALIARGALIDPRTQTLPVLFAVDNPGARLPIGAFARVFIANGDAHRAPAVPSSALVDDAGTTVVYVQAEGEAFERRVLRLGVSDRGYAEVLAGVQPGERVVTRGAWAIKLSSASGAVPAHGHAH
jgi:cobalt-zinc-cadmium efflux system membrane fusion protein